MSPRQYNVVFAICISLVLDLTKGQDLPDLEPTGNQTAPTDSEGDQEDEAWNAIHDPGWPFLRWIMSSKSVTITMEDLVKHQELNKKAFYIAPKKRELLSQFLESYRPLLKEAHEEAQQRSHTEFAELVRSEGIPPLEYKEDSRVRGTVDKAMRSIRDRGLSTQPFIPDPSFYETPSGKNAPVLFRFSKGRTYGAAYEDLPKSRPYVETAHSLSRDVASQIVAWFASEGLLAPGESFTLLETILTSRPGQFDYEDHTKH